MPRGIEDPGFIPRYNIYSCTVCGKPYLSVDLAAGVTPLFMTCFVTEGCPGKAVSAGYPERLNPFGIPLLIEWVKPDLQEMVRVKNPALLEHFENGGLMRRATDTAPEWVKKLV